MSRLLRGISFVVMLAAGVSPVAAAQVWLAGIDPVVWRHTRPGEPSDYMNLFQDGSLWRKAAAHVQVFKISTQFFVNSTDQELEAVLSGLRARHIDVAIEAAMLAKSQRCGNNLEGYSSVEIIRKLASRVKRLGGELNYVAMDEPLWFGHHFGGHHACRSSIADVAAVVARNVAYLRNVFPDIKVGDIEPFAVPGQPADWLDEIAQWIAAYRAATGENLAFFHADMNWHQNWRPQLAALVPVLKAAGIEFGIIYDGYPDDTTGVAWTRHAEEHFVAVDSDPMLVPDQAVLQTWMRHPTHMLPESQPGTMTWLVNRYAAAETHLTVHRNGSRVEGDLTGPSGTPVAGQSLQVEAVDVHDAGPPMDRTISGTVPPGADFALFALRINAECDCSGPVDVKVGTLQYRDSRTGNVVQRTFSVPDADRIPQGIHITGAIGQKFTANTTSWPVGPGVPWVIDLRLGASALSHDSGYLFLIFARKDRREVQRVRIPLDPVVRDLGKAVTDARGHFALTPSPSVMDLNPRFRVEFSGSPGYRLSQTATP